MPLTDKIKEEDEFKWLSKLTDGKVTTFEDVDTFNEEAEDRGDEDFISIYEYEVMEWFKGRRRCLLPFFLYNPLN